MQCFKEFLETINLLHGSILSIFAIGAFLLILINKLSPLKRGDDGFYYKRKGKKPYCPHCYEDSRKRARVINKQCTKCNKSFRIPPVVIEVVKPIDTGSRFNIQ
jgi:hypothetical protein